MELFAFILYFVIVIAIGLLFFLRSKSEGEKDYFLGGRSMGPFVTAMSAQASDMSGWLLMGFPGSILAFGMGQAWIGIGLAIGTALNWIFCAKRLRCFSKQANDSITLPQYLSNRFLAKGKALQVFCAIIFLSDKGEKERPVPGVLESKCYLVWLLFLAARTKAVSC